MKKKKVIKLNIDIIFIVYIVIALIATIISNLEIEELQEIVKLLKYGSVMQSITLIFIFVLVNAFLTIFQQIYVIVLYVGYKIAIKKHIKDKLNKDDFEKTKIYYRDVLQNYSPALLSYIDDFKLELPKDIIATLLQLRVKNILEINNEKIIIKENYEEVLDENEKYLCMSINTKGIETHESELYNKVREDALNKGLIEQTKDIKSKKVKKIVKSIITFLIMLIITILLFMKIDAIHTDNAIIVLAIFFGIAILMIGLIIYPMIMAVSLFIYMFQNRLNPYVRTERGEEINRKIEGLKKYLQDYSLLDERESNAVANWEEYLVYSVLFGQNTKIVKEYQKYIK